MKKTIIIMADSRNIHDLSALDYHHYTAAINKLYAESFGYDFKWCTTKISNLDIAFSHMKYFWRNLLKRKNHTDGLSKRVPSVFNIKNKYARAAPWIKLIAVSEIMSENYDHIVYIDSDCAFKDHVKSLDGYLNNAPTVEGSPSFEKSSICFLMNYPWSKNLPCSGFFVVKKHAGQLLGDWWDLDNKEYNFKHDYEQNSLHKIFPSYKHQICVLNDYFFIEKRNQYLRHVHSGESKERLPYFRNLFSSIAPRDDSLESIIKRTDIVFLPPKL